MSGKKKTFPDIQSGRTFAWSRRGKIVSLRRHFYRRHPAVTSITAFALILAAVLGADTFLGHANTVYWYPASCLGGWTGVQNAAEVPEVPWNAPSDQFTTDNSAVLTNALSEIFCGGFKGDVPDNTVPTSATLTLSWVFKPLNAPMNNANGTSTPVDNATTTEATDVILPEAAPASDIIPIPDSLPVVSPADSSSTTSFFRFIPVAFADDTTTVPLPEDVIATTTTADAPATDAVNDNILEVRYSTDGTNWSSLGLINSSNWQGAQFSLPIADWQAVQNLQVSIRSVGTADAAPAVYLDGMSLSVEYASTEVPSVPPAPVVSANGPNSFDFVTATSSADGAASDITLSMGDDGNGGQALQVDVTSGASIAFYDLDDLSFSISSGVGGQAVVMPLYDFPPGNFVVIDTSDPGACSGIDVEACRERAGYIGEAAFSVR